MKIGRFIKTQELEELIRSGEKVHLLESWFGTEGKSFEVIEGTRRVGWSWMVEGGNAAYMPSEDVFVRKMQEVGVKDDDCAVVVYDRDGFRPAAKLSLAFRLFGRKNVAVLEGGFEKWLQENRKVESSAQPFNPLSTPPQYSKNPKLLKHFEYISAISDLLSKDNPQTLTRILDSRSALRFTGLADEPIIQQKAKIPGSKNLPVSYLYNKDMTLKSPSEMRKTLENYNIDLDDSGNIIHLSGCNFSASYNFLALEELGFTNQFLYDGGLADWVLKFKFSEPSVSVKGMLENSYELYLKSKKNN